MRIPCPRCPDGSVWTREGTTGATCPRCNGHAFLNADGSQVTGDDDELDDDYDCVIHGRQVGPDCPRC